ncbi:MAG: YybH family protein [bacterium]
MEEIESLILSLEKEQVGAFNRGDVDRILSFFDPDIVGFSSTKHDRFAGLDDLRKTFEYYLQKTSKLEYSISDTSVQVFGDTAILSFYWLVAMIFGKTRREVQGRGSHVYRRKNGEWKIVHEHFSRAHHAYEK